jgi:hypothetical protein
MPFILLLFGAVLAISAYRGTTEELFDLLKGDFTGESNFFYWIVSIAGIGLIGYIPRMEGVSRLFFVLLFVVMFVSNRGIFDQFTNAIQTASSEPEDAKPDADYIKFTKDGGSEDGGTDDAVAIGSTILRSFL